MNISEILTTLEMLKKGAGKFTRGEKEASRQEKKAHRKQNINLRSIFEGATGKAEKLMNKGKLISTLARLVPGVGTIVGGLIDMGTGAYYGDKAQKEGRKHIEDAGLLDWKNKYTADIGKFHGEFGEDYMAQTFFDAIGNAIKNEIVLAADKKSGGERSGKFDFGQTDDSLKWKDVEAFGSETSKRPAGWFEKQFNKAIEGGGKGKGWESAGKLASYPSQILKQFIKPKNLMRTWDLTKSEIARRNQPTMYDYDLPASMSRPESEYRRPSRFGGYV